MSGQHAIRSTGGSVNTIVRAPKHQPKSSAWFWFRENILARSEAHVSRPILSRNVQRKPKWACGRKWFTFRDLIYGWWDELFGAGSCVTLITTTMGYGLRFTPDDSMSTQQAIVHLMSTLTGSLVPLTDLKTESLANRGRVSIIEKSKGNYFEVVGPISLVNHCCISSFGFKVVNTMVTLLDIIKDVDEEERGDYLLPSAGSELFIQYSQGPLEFSCRCPKCVTMEQYLLENFGVGREEETDLEDEDEFVPEEDFEEESFEEGDGVKTGRGARERRD